RHPHDGRPRPDVRVFDLRRHLDVRTNPRVRLGTEDRLLPVQLAHERSSSARTALGTSTSAEASSIPRARRPRPAEPVLAERPDRRPPGGRGTPRGGADPPPPPAAPPQAAPTCSRPPRCSCRNQWRDLTNRSIEFILCE